VYPEQTSSLYILPYPVGETHNVRQGNCNALNTHNPRYNSTFAYDFEMPIGNEVVASRGGTVQATEDRFSDSGHDADRGNYLVLVHEDATYAIYGHLMQRGLVARKGDKVDQGDLLARSGNSGLSRGPHLHFAVYDCVLRMGPWGIGCDTVPVTFRNTRAHPRGLQGSPTSEIGGGEWYEAEVW
jgi:murein DD-endopeptidase MepM/ murein hydrolase activator NlpD